MGSLATQDSNLEANLSVRRVKNRQGWSLIFAAPDKAAGAFRQAFAALRFQATAF